MNINFPKIIALLLKKIIFTTFFITCGLISYSQQNQHYSYYPLQLGNSWSYSGQIREEKIIDTLRIDEKIYYGLSDWPNDQLHYWLREEDSKIFITKNTSAEGKIDSVEYMLFDFNAEIGESWDLKGFECLFGNQIKLIGKTDTIITSLDTFTHCYHFKHTPFCNDAGYSDSWFAPEIGKVKYYESTFGGGNVMMLTDYELAYEIVFIPDSSFLFAIIEDGVDLDGDSLISKSEAEAIQILDVSGKGISDLTGIEKFVNLTSINCSENKLTHLNLTKNYLLDTIYCQDNQLASLDISNNHQLKTVDCSGNRIKNLDVAKNTELVQLNCSNNELKNLDVSMNPLLVYLSCSNNQLTNLDISYNSFITNLFLAEMDSLGRVCVWENPFPPDNSEVDTTGSPNAFFTANCSYHTVYIPDTSFLFILLKQKVDINRDSLISYGEAEAVRELNLGGLPNSGGYCFGKTHIIDYTGIEAFANLTFLDCSCGDADSLDLSNNKFLEHLNCMGNQLNYLNVSENFVLTELLCNNNQLTTLDVSNSIALNNLQLIGNQLTNLDISNNPDLTYLNCENNLLEELNLSNNLKLEYLNCGFNPFLTLDLSNNVHLTFIRLIQIPNLGEVCVWTSPFPPEGVNVYTTYSPNVSFTTNCSVTGLAQKQLFDFLIYPNPVKDKLIIETGSISSYLIELLSMNGEILFKAKINKAHYVIKLSSFPKGLYLLSVQSDKSKQVKKVIVF